MSPKVGNPSSGGGARRKDGQRKAFNGKDGRVFVVCATGILQEFFSDK